MEDCDPVDGTLETYESICDAYASRNASPAPVLAEYLDVVAALAGTGRVIELGSGSGVDADYLGARGVQVTRTDAARAFVERLRGLGHDAHRLDVRTDPLGGPWDVVMANAVLLHLPRREFSAAVMRIAAALRTGGVFALTLKEGIGSEWTTAKVGYPRYFTYWQEEPLRAELASAGLSVDSLDHVPGSLDETWLYVIARKLTDEGREGRRC